MSFQKLKTEYVASSRQYTASGGEVQVHAGGINEWRNDDQGDCYTDW